MSFIEAAGVCKRYGTRDGGVQALEDLDLAVELGEFVVVLGPSGCGKSTLLLILAGLEPVSSGRVWLDGRAITHWGAERSLIFQRPALFPWLTAEGNVAFGLRMAGHDGADSQCSARAALARMGLEWARRLYPHELSGGMQQRVALARALLLKPLVLLMDEPLASLDPSLRANLQRELRLSCAGQTVLWVTHSVREALVLADRVLILTPRPGRVCREIVLDGLAPRECSPTLLRLEQQLERECLDGAAN